MMSQASTPNSASTTKRLSIPFEMPDLENGSVLSTDEVCFFKDNGFVIKKGLLDSRSVSGSLDQSWDYLQSNIPLQTGCVLNPRDRRTWIDPKWAKMPPPDTSGFYEGRQRNVYDRSTLKLHDLGSEDFLLELLPNNRSVRRVAQFLLGENLRPSRRTRGVYAVFPTSPSDTPISGKMLGPHSDQVCQQLNVCAYLDNVPPRNGGFTIYPGSHRIMHFAHKFEANWSPLSSYGDCVREVVRKTEPLELVADAGDVIFWHGRLIHSAGIHIGSDIRWAVFGDFSQDRPTQTDEQHRRAGQYEWFKDTKLFIDDLPPTDDMWRSWNI